MTLRETQAELFSLADDVQKLVIGQEVNYDKNLTRLLWP